MPAGQCVLTEISSVRGFNAARTINFKIFELTRWHSQQNRRTRQNDRTFLVDHGALDADGMSLDLILDKNLHGHDLLQTLVEQIHKRRGMNRARRDGKKSEQKEATEKGHGLMT